MARDFHSVLLGDSVGGNESLLRKYRLMALFSEHLKITQLLIWQISLMLDNHRSLRSSIFIFKIACI